MKPQRANLLVAVLLILATAAFRVANAELHFWNFAPVAALGLFSGAVVGDKRLAFLFTLLAQLASDLYFQLFTDVPGFYGISQLFTYAGMVAVTALGMVMQNRKAATVAGFALGASLLFFVVSNFGVWLTGMYGLTGGGLAKTFVMAVPFYKGTLIGDLLFSAILFGGFAWMQRPAARLETAVA
jgi:hypothetical protein